MLFLPAYIYCSMSVISNNSICTGRSLDISHDDEDVISLHREKKTSWDRTVISLGLVLIRNDWYTDIHGLTS